MAKKDESPAPSKKAQPDLPLDHEPGPAPEKVPDPEWYAGEMDPLPEDDAALTTGETCPISKTTRNGSLATPRMVK